MIIAWDNKADAASLSTDSEIDTLPASNVQHADVVKKWHTAAGVKSAYLIMDLGSSLSCSILALLGTNLTPTATIQIRGSVTDATVTGSLAYDSGVIAAGAIADYGAVYKSFAATASRYWRIDLADTAVDSNLRVGRLFLGPSWTPTIAQQLPWRVLPVDPSRKVKSTGGQTRADRRPKYRVVQFTLDFMTEDEMFDNAFALARANGVVDDVLAVSDISGSYLSQQAVFGPLEASEPLVNERLGVWRQQFSIEERL